MLSGYVMRSEGEGGEWSEELGECLVPMRGEVKERGGQGKRS